MSSEIKIFYPKYNSLRAVVYNPDATQIWTSTGFVTRASATPRYVTLADVSDVGFYTGNFPSITIAGAYPVEIEEVTTGNTAGSQIILWNGSAVPSSVSVPVISLTDVESADDYFASRLYVQVWTNSTSNNKQLALNEATRIINRLGFIGRKTSNTQSNEWPRTGVQIDCQTLDAASIPPDIAAAQFEIAFALLKGIDIEREARSAGVTSRGYSSVRITYDTAQTPEYLLYGIPSMVAWAYLSPYLKRNLAGAIYVHRVS